MSENNDEKSIKSEAIAEIEEIEDFEESEDIPSEIEEETKELFEYEEKEFEKPIEDYKESIKKCLPKFKEIFLKRKDDTFENLKTEIENIFNEYYSKHFHSLVLYCGRTYEFIIYQIGWYILDEWKYKNLFRRHDHPDNMKTFQEIITEIKEYLKIYTGSNHRKILERYQKKISERRNDVAHPCQFGQLRDVGMEDAEDTLENLTNAFEFFCSKFEEILQR